MLLRQFSVAAVLALVTVSTATKQKAPENPISGTDTVHGCYKSVGTMTIEDSIKFNSQGECAGLCRSKGMTTGASNAHDCYCGNEYPNKADLVDDDQCTEPCPGFGDEACGGLDTFTVYNTGVRVSVGEADQPGSSSSSSTSTPEKTTASSSVPTSTADTVETVTSAPEQSSGGTNVAGIAAGVVVGVVAAAAIVGGVIFWLRRKRNAEIEEEHRRNAAVNAFITGGKPPSSSGGLSMSDSRLDPVMNRRMSDGSIADNQDYSRRILRVTNA
ncbi:Protein SLG1 [Parahypoxylon ruwenzoriense]